MYRENGCLVLGTQAEIWSESEFGLSDADWHKDFAFTENMSL